MKKVLLMVPQQSKIKDVKQTDPIWPRVGIAYIAGYLREHKVSVGILDCKAEKIGIEEAEESLSKFKPDIIGITAFTEEILEAYHLCRKSKQINKKIITVIGGPHVSAIPERTLQECQSLDIVVYGEGEETLLEIVKIKESSDLQKIDGIVYRDEGKIIRNKPRKLIKNVDSLPYPAWDLFPLHKYVGVTMITGTKGGKNILELPILAARGCPFGCNFCYKVYGRSVRSRNYKKVVDEIEYNIGRYGATQFFFVEGTFGVIKKESFDLCNEIIKRKLNEKIKWLAETRVDIVTEEMLSLMKLSGCILVAFGVETGDHEILKNSGKGTTLEQVREAIRLAKKVGLIVTCFFIIGHPTETMESIQRTINFAKELDPDVFNMGIMIPYPGTDIQKMAEQGKGNYKIRSRDWSDYTKQRGGPLELNNISIDELRRIQASAYLHFYLRPKKILFVFKNFPPSKIIKISIDLLKNIPRKFN